MPDADNDQDLRLIEDYLPIEAISREASREKSIRKGHISTLHLWWARRPLVACRAAVYGALVPADRWVPEVNLKNPPDDPDKAEAVRNGKKRGLNRRAAGEFVARLCKYPKASSAEEVRDVERHVAEAQRHILEAHADRLTAELAEARKLPLPPGEGWGEGAPAWLDEFKWPRDKAAVTYEDIVAGRAPRPRVLDMFAGGGAIPLEALRLGCEAYALDLNPVAHIIELCTLVYPQKYGKPDPTVRGMTGPPISPRPLAGEGVGVRGVGRTTSPHPGPLPKGEGAVRSWGGLAEEVRYWGNWVLQKVKAEIGDLYPPIPDPEAPAEEIGGDSQQRMDFAKGEQQRLTVPKGYLTPVAYLWTRTVRCKNPSCGATVPLVKQTWLCKKKGRYVALKMVAPKGEKKVRFEVVEAATEKALGFDPTAFSKAGNATCPFCGTVADAKYTKKHGLAEQVGSQLLAVVCRKAGRAGTRFVGPDDLPMGLLPTDAVIRQRSSRLQTPSVSAPDEKIPDVRPSPNARGLTAPTRHGLTTFSQLFHPRQLLSLLTQCAAVQSASAEMERAGMGKDRLRAIASYLGIVVDRMADRGSSLCRWDASYTKTQSTFGRPALPFVWDFSETNPFGDASGDMNQAIEWVCQVIEETSKVDHSAEVSRGSALELPCSDASIDAVVTDPPYYDNVPYGDLSDFFYVWLKRSIAHLYPDHFAAALTPKKSEATALSSRTSGDMAAASGAYEEMMCRAFEEAHRVLKPRGEIVAVYAHKTTLGWATLVDALRRSGFTVSEAWPLDTEFGGRLIALDASALASSIFLVARKRERGAGIGAYEDDVQPELERIVRERVESLWEMGITGADLVIAAVGAGLRAFTRFERVEYANGEEVPAEKFLAEVEAAVLETLMAKVFGRTNGNVAGVDANSRFYVLWRYVYKAAEIDAGEAIVFTYGQHVELDGPQGLSTGKDALLEKKKGKYRLRDFTERGESDSLGLPDDSQAGKPVPLIDVLHRALWLMENQPRRLGEFLNEAAPNREQLRLVAAALAGPGLSGKSDEDSRRLLATTPDEQSALGKMLGNWKSLVPESLFDAGKR